MDVVDITGKVLFIDTNVLDELNPAQFARFMTAVEAKTVTVATSKVVVWEHAKHKYRGPNEQSPYGAGAILPDNLKAQVLLSTYHGVKEGFNKAGITVLDLPPPHLTADLMSMPNLYFKGNRRHHKDAVIACTAIHGLSPQNTIIVCAESEKRLGGVFLHHGFTVCKSLLDIMPELAEGPNGERHDLFVMKEVYDRISSLDMDEDLMDLLKEAEPESAKRLILIKAGANEVASSAPLADSEVLPELTGNAPNLSIRLEQLGKNDELIRINLLGAAYAFRSTERDVLISEVERMGEGHVTADVEMNLEMLVREGLLMSAGGLILPNIDSAEAMTIGAEAMTLIFEDVLEAGGLNE